VESNPSFSVTKLRRCRVMAGSFSWYPSDGDLIEAQRITPRTSVS
jgi:hypothetical protein